MKGHHEMLGHLLRIRGVVGRQGAAGTRAYLSWAWAGSQPGVVRRPAECRTRSQTTPPSGLSPENVVLWRDEVDWFACMTRFDRWPKTRRTACVLAALSVALCVLGSARAVVIFRRNAADSAEMTRLFVGMALPLALALAGMVTTLGERIGPLWFNVGALFGFVVAAAWSLGLFYAYGALALLAAAIVHLVTIRPRWRIILAPLWFLTGVGALPAIILLLGWAQESAYHHTVQARAAVWGSWLFAAVSAILAVIYAGAALVRRRLHEQ